MNNSEEKYFAAREKMENLKQFYAHLIIFVFVNLVFLSFNYYKNYIEFPWVLWGTFGWGIGLGFDYLKAFDKNLFLARDWEKRKIKEIMNQKD
ncbi:2TM domain-containing protein [Zunongwangia endophytica]|uniref:2TM domain-containing protein n=1 Tax=Zunongwangia endophytica TaxID=1808945 RepID=A0ABV8HA80_9FLAO|nr:2TM domain-containing protein [Zunongwangia endophytica]MDN3593802.1 2TM domain-containing protein [Zunongwangia endophytica]